FFVLGSPVAKSPSPALHNHIFKTLGLPHEISELASSAQVVNTIVKHDDGSLSFHNTDTLALAESIRIKAALASTCLVVGTGGAARAACAAAELLGMEKIFVSAHRTPALVVLTLSSAACQLATHRSGRSGGSQKIRWYLRWRKFEVSIGVRKRECQNPRADRSRDLRPSANRVNLF
ncbi:hypothetical protein FOZ62_000207, partial [Perkinsus olseni]